jgi:uncharacterized Zn-finger protein
MSILPRRYSSLMRVDKNNTPHSCPPKGATIWNMHPKVFLEFVSGKASCPYCGSKFELKQ